MSRSSSETKPVSSTSPGGGGQTSLLDPPKKSAAPDTVAPLGQTDPDTGVVTLPDPELVKRHRAPTRTYWIGTLDDCPFQNVTAGGQCFPHHLGHPEFDEKTGLPDRALEYGATVELTDAQVERVKHGIANRVLRRFGERSKMLNVDGKKYRADADLDRPLGEFVYMVDLTAAGHKPQFPPPPMIRRR